MSRTIRRKNCQWHNSYRWYFFLEKRGTEYGRYYNDQYDRELEANYIRCSSKKDIGKIAVKKYFHSDSYESLKNPKWWIRQHDTKPRRVKDRTLNRLVLHLDDLEDWPIYPELGGWIPSY